MKQLFKIITFCFVLLGLNQYAFTQIVQSNTMTVKQLVENVLVGAGVTATNIKVNGSTTLAQAVQVQASYYSSGTTNFPIGEGVLLTTGRFNVAPGPNNSGSSSNATGTLLTSDPDLTGIASSDITNGIVIEFDFLATGNKLEFKYVFASEEYPEYAGSTYNDVFGFFLSGPDINGTVNIAKVPGTNLPVSINNVNHFTNQQYYINNVGGAYYGNAIQYDGTTTVLTAEADITCGNVYHIKLAISNVGDTGWDSGVFLEAGSFTTNPIEFAFNTFTTDNTMYEGCEHVSQLIFNRAGCGDENLPLIAYVELGGTATNGVDYSLLADSVILPGGVNQIIWDIIPFEDYILEGVETIDIHVWTVDQVTGDTLHGYGQFLIDDRPPLIVNGVDKTYYCIEHDILLEATTTGGLAPITLVWNETDTVNTVTLNLDSNGVYSYIVQVTDGCGYTHTDTMYITMNQTLRIDTLMMTPATCLPVGTVWTESFPYGAHLQNQNNPTSYNLTFDWTYLPDTNLVFPNQSAHENLSGGWYKLVLTDNVINCTVTDSVFVDVVDVPIAQLEVNPGGGCAPLDVTFSNSSQSSNTYYWDFGNGETAVTYDLNDISKTYNYTSQIQLVASNGDVNCNDTTLVVVEIVTCGCMDPIGLNYNPNAVIDDGSCVYPYPTVTPPNVITVNQDGINDFYFLETTHATNIELTILNRWGNIVFKGNGNQASPPMWDGKDKSGANVTPGVYFYRYKVEGMVGDPLEGHGFITVVE